MSNRVYARQIPPEYQESPLYKFDEWPENVYIFGNRHFNGRGGEFIENIKNTMYDAADELKQLMSGSGYYNSFIDLISDLLPEPDNKIKYSRADRLEWRRLLLAYDAGAIRGDDAARAALEIITGRKYEYSQICGCCQGDWQNIIYPAEYGREWLAAFETEYFNTGTEWIIHDGETPPECPEDITGFCAYCLGWSDEQIRAEIADYANGDPENVILYKFSNWIHVAGYAEV